MSSEYRLDRFEKSKAKGKKYSAILINKRTGRQKTVNFGASSYEHYKDTTGKGLYTHLDHNDTKRRASFRARFKNMAKRIYSPAYFAYKYLW